MTKTAARNTQDHSSDIRSYVTGFILSILLSIMPFLMVTYKTLDGIALVLSLVGFAVLQLFVQLIFFLHLGRGNQGKWNGIVLAFAAIVVGIVVIGSLWIMYNLNYHMTAEETEQHLLEDQGIER